MADLDDFLRHGYDRVVRSVAVACGDIDAAEAAVQAALVEALEYEKRGRHIADLSAWVFVVATNKNRRRFRRAETERLSLERMASMARAPSLGVEDRSLELWPSVLALPIRQRQVVLLFYVHDLSVRKIADLLEVREGTVKTALHRARATLAVRLGPAAATTVDADKEQDYV